ncbi:MAG: 50S ribosomal L9 C-terminal domain-containing protein [Anaerolineaceae bacterium]
MYGSITSQMIAEAISAKIGSTVERRQIDMQPIRVLGEHKVHVRLTIDLIPEIKVIVHREGEMPAGLVEEVAVVEPAAAPAAEETAAAE